VFWFLSATVGLKMANFLCFTTQNISWPVSLGPSDAFGTPNHHSLDP
jgi:hypothetical protein